MKRRLALAFAVVLCAAIGGGVWLAREAFARAELDFAEGDRDRL